MLDPARELLGWAQAHVPLWAELLGGRDAASLPWEAVPAVDRALLAARFDDTVADRRVTRARALAHYRADPAAPLDGLRVFVSAGAAGTPAPFVYDEPMWDAYLGGVRRRLHAAGVAPGDRLALVGTSDPAHTLPRLGAIWPPERLLVCGLQEGVDACAERLERFAPDAVYGLSSAVELLAAHGVRIAPRAVLVGTDALSPGGRETIAAAFGVEPCSSYATTEAGIVAFECRAGAPMHVDERAVRLDRCGAGVLVTNLVNRVQPVIRLRLPEAVEVRDERCACGGARRVLTLPGGRENRPWRLRRRGGGDVVVHPIVLRSALDPLVLDRLPETAVEGGQLVVRVAERDVARVAGCLAPALAAAGADPEAVSVLAVP